MKKVYIRKSEVIELFDTIVEHNRSMMSKYLKMGKDKEIDATILLQTTLAWASVLNGISGTKGLDEPALDDDGVDYRDIKNQITNILEGR